MIIIEFHDVTQENVVIGQATLQPGMPVPDVGDLVQFPDTNAGFSHVHYGTVKGRQFYFDEKNLTKAVVYVSTK